MRILLTGANGYIGMRLLPLLLVAAYHLVHSLATRGGASSTS